MKIKKLIKKLTPQFLLNFYYWLWAFAGAVLFWFPSKNLMVIGITGTSGKSTTVDFITRILEEAGNKVVSNSSIRFKIGDKEWPNNLKMGMPGRFFMQKLLRQGVKGKCNYAVLEVTSEGIKQFRHKFINFDTAVFTNLSPEHVESHGGFENYRSEKLKLFKATKNTHIINIDDENAKYFLEIPAKEISTFGIKNNESKIDRSANSGRFLRKIEAENVSFNNRINFSVNNSVNNLEIISLTNLTTVGFVRPLEIHLNLLGEFNVYNALAAIAVSKNYGISLEICKKALEKVSGIPGRMEIVAKNPFLVVVDYAHTPEQLEKVYQTLSKISNTQYSISNEISNSKLQTSNLVCVIGSCGGGRDKWKRPVLGKIASQYCKEIIITNEDPYDEDPIQILSEIKSGISNNQFPMTNFHEILDRREAIKKAIQLAKPGDTIIITGKGSESLMCLENGKKIPWDDLEVVREELEKIKTKIQNISK